jgi:hypothetical protein
MSQVDSGFSENQKDSLSWALIAELLKIVEKPVTPTERFPASFFGQTFELEDRNRQSLMSIARRSNRVITDSTELPDMFQRIQNDSLEACLWVLSESNITITDDPSTRAMAGSAIAKHFSSLALNEEATIEWAWLDATDGMDDVFEPKTNLLSNFEVPKHWQELESPIESADWMAWIWVTSLKGKPLEAYNFANGELISVT